MGFFKKLFKKNSIEKEDEWDKVQANRFEIDMSNAYLREQYVISCLEQMKDASREIDRITSEYATVTSYLTDIEEIEALSEEDREELASLGKKIHDLRKKYDMLSSQESTMNEHEFARLRSLEDDIPDAIKKLTEEEDYRARVKSDLQKIDKEKQAYTYRKREVANSIENARGIAIIVMVSAAALIVILFALSAFLKWEVTLFYYVTIALAAILDTILYIRYSDNVAEKRRIESTYNELILLENKVKIRYVNNKNLLDYLYTKYDVESAAKLRASYDNYIKEKEARKAFERTEEDYEIATAKLLRFLKSTRVTDPELWISQSDALYDKKEMVEVRHHLIGRRQKLRKQLEYNEQIALEASDEVKDVIKKYPESGPALMELMNKYES